MSAIVARAKQSDPQRRCRTGPPFSPVVAALRTSHNWLHKAASLNAPQPREDRPMPTRRSFVASGLGAGAVLAAPGAREACRHGARRLIRDGPGPPWDA